MSQAVSFQSFEQTIFVSPTFVEQGISVVAAMVLLITLVLAYQRLVIAPNKNNQTRKTFRFSLVAIANIVSFITLVILINDVKISTDDTRQYILLTNGTSQQQLSSLTLNSDDEIYLLPQYQNKLEMNEVLDTSRFTKNVSYINSIEQLMLMVPTLSNLHVLGDGLTQLELHYLTGVELTFKFSEAVVGPVNMSWEKQLFIGQALTVQGQFQSLKNSQNGYLIALFDMNDQPLANYRIKNKENFHFSAVVKTTGLFVYQLKVFDDNKNLLSSEPIAFEITDPILPAIVIKQSSASFESRHIKNWAEQQGSKILVLTQVSKNKQIQQQVNFDVQKKTQPRQESPTAKGQVKESNRSKFNISTLDPKFELITKTWLKDFDLFIIDGRALLALTPDEHLHLKQAVINGLGLLILADKSLVSAFENTPPAILASYHLSQVQNDVSRIKNKGANQQRLTNVWWRNSSVSSNSSSSYENEAQQNEELLVPFKNVNMSAESANTLIYGHNNKPLVISSHLGLGRVAVSLINQSYQWAISGQKTAHSRYWQYLMTQLSKNRIQTRWQHGPADKISYLGEPLQLCAYSSEENLTAEPILLQKTFANESKYCGIDWSNKSGWQQYSLFKGGQKKSNQQPISQQQSNEIGSATNNLSQRQLLAQQAHYIYPKDSWLTWQQAQKHQASQQMEKANKPIVPTKSHQAINKVLVWLLFFMSLSFLWIEQKTYK